MTASLLLKILNDLNQLEHIELEQLDELTLEHPSCQNFQFLRIKKMQLLGMEDQIEEFQKLTSYITDHGHLYDRMTNSECEENSEEIASKQLDKKLEKSIRTAEKAAQEKLESVTPPEIPIKQEVTVEKNPEEILEYDLIERPERKAPKIKKKKSKKKKRKAQKAKLKKLKLKKSELKKSKVEKLKAESKIKKMKTSKKTKDDRILDVEKQETENLIVELHREIEELRAMKTQEVLVNEEEKVEYSPFTEWLRTLQPTHQEVLDDEKPILSAGLKKAKSKSKAKLKKSEEKSKTKKGKSKEKSEGIKPDSHKKSKKKKRKKKKKSKLQDKINKSLERKSQVVSPTLAKIMANQGHIKEAIDIYKQLMLIYPEKSSYFAVQIKNLE